jgi:hypothetical protein
METKTVRAELKQAGDEGSFEAVIATLGVVDHDGDIVEHGALAGKTASIVGAHQQHTVPLGKVRIEERGDSAIALGKFNLSVSTAKDWHEAIKFDLANPPAVQEWSWGYSPINATRDTLDGEPVRRLLDVDLMEVSPVLRGASIGTRTIGVKAVSPRHKTETSDAPWRVPAKAEAGAYACAKGKLFVHHFCDDAGAPGAASLRACMIGIAALKGVRGCVVMSDEEARAVYDHLAGHLKDAGIEPPTLEPGMRLVDEVRLVAYDAEAAIGRLRDASAQREADGKSSISSGAKAAALEMAAVVDEMTLLSRQLGLMADRVAPKDAVARALTAWTAHQARGMTG